MGWASAGAIFNPVALALIELNAPNEMKRRVLGDLIKALQDGDWDTEDESLYEFRYDVGTVSAFYACGVGNEIEGAGVAGVIAVGRRPGCAFVLSCSSCGELTVGDDSAGTHDLLVREWAEHDHQVHDGDGVVDQDMLIANGIAHWIVPS